MGSSRRPTRVQYANFFHDVILGSTRMFCVERRSECRGNYLHTLHPLNMARGLAYEVINHQSRDYSNSQLPDSRIIISETAERRESKNWDLISDRRGSAWSSSGVNLPPSQVWVVISEVFGCFGCHSPANIRHKDQALVLSPCRFTGNHLSSLCTGNFTQRLADFGLVFWTCRRLYTTLCRPSSQFLWISRHPHEVVIFGRQFWIWAHDLAMFRDSFKLLA